MKITFFDEPIETVGTPAEVGEIFPSFEVKNSQGETVKSGALLKGTTLISVVPDINTSVCSLQTKHFNQSVDQFEGINFYTISTNTVEDQKHWCAAEGVEKMELLSDADFDFGKKSELLIPDKSIDQRSVWILDETGKVLYRQLLIEQTNEPDYDKALDFLKNL
ncbi:thioredoxin peroxidase [Lactobacillus pasteurii DSM 23907 = CRBIP 24.76]|uniref:Thiol peroxidase (Hydroperoxide reductase, Peroxiredoxin) n=1 Tax=Lactobacillus pasteurii DSM 23907 = CRBIP 24.76 TaxID=1423790 RepID=I7J108_9LACO|nr:peroxiredoxin [Lactobacillus pasteurii]KRK08886.1 thioredoxin peroxidase [Lactobacillus pasteurii DSM 23907 = CRBIP 24.76]TDG76279.1 hypothetical protein C5L33_001038 [Lactobacillus pasteurii]CCI85997.1 Thiol peroxidase (Hydroperoxide reductase, Peroxiredoxin) [Lactobacillus pasteurii DSM 23907 = CRBIP 24.76]